MKSPEYDVCFIGLKCGDLLTGREPARYLGGIERDLVSIAVELTALHHKVAFITYLTDSERMATVNGIDIFPAFKPDKGIRGVRFFYPQFSGMAKTIASVRAKNYVQMGAGTETGMTAIAARLFQPRAKFVFATASDADCRRELPALRRRVDRVMYRCGLSLAKQVITQTVAQKILLERNFDRASSVLRLPSTVARQTIEREPEVSLRTEPSIIWVGRLDRIKRPDRLLEIAERCPNVTFDLIGDANSDNAYAADIRRRASEATNIRLWGKVGASEMSEIYRQAKILCCTSEIEGFPAVFLEAWSFGLPVLTMFDPDSLIEKYQAGAVCKSVDEMVNVINSGDVARYQRHWRENAGRLFARQFSPEILTRKFCEIVISDSRRP